MKSNNDSVLVMKVLSDAMKLFISHAEKEGVKIGGMAILVEANGQPVTAGRTMVAEVDSLTASAALAAMIYNAFGEHASTVHALAGQILADPDGRSGLSKISVRKPA